MMEASGRNHMNANVSINANANGNPNSLLDGADGSAANERLVISPSTSLPLPRLGRNHRQHPGHMDANVLPGSNSKSKSNSNDATTASILNMMGAGNVAAATNGSELLSSTIPPSSPSPSPSNTLNAMKMPPPSLATPTPDSTTQQGAINLLASASLVGFKHPSAIDINASKLPSKLGTKDNKIKTKPKPKPRGPRPKAKPSDIPRRPLSAYNIFFSEQRELILREIDTKATGKVFDLSKQPCTEELLKPLMKTTRTKRPHRKVHGKIGLVEMARTVGKRWSTLNAQDRKKYYALAAKDKINQELAMKEYDQRVKKEGERKHQLQQLEQHQLQKEHQREVAAQHFAEQAAINRAAGLPHSSPLAAIHQHNFGLDQNYDHVHDHDHQSHHQSHQLKRCQLQQQLQQLQQQQMQLQQFTTSTTNTNISGAQQSQPNNDPFANIMVSQSSFNQHQLNHNQQQQQQDLLTMLRYQNSDSQDLSNNHIGNNNINSNINGNYDGPSSEYNNIGTPPLSFIGKPPTLPPGLSTMELMEFRNHRRDAQRLAALQDSLISAGHTSTSTTIGGDHQQAFISQFGSAPVASSFGMGADGLFGTSSSSNQGTQTTLGGGGNGNGNGNGMSAMNSSLFPTNDAFSAANYGAAFGGGTGINGPLGGASALSNDAGFSGFRDQQQLQLQQQADNFLANMQHNEAINNTAISFAASNNNANGFHHSGHNTSSNNNNSNTGGIGNLFGNLL